MKGKRSKENAFAVVMAGGRGSRFWPRSRKRRSKQVLNIVGKKTMIQDTVARLSPLFPPSRILIVTNRLLEEEIRRQLPKIPRQNVLAEPAARSTAPCIGLAALHARARCPGSIMAVFSADHLIVDGARFRADVETALRLASGGDRLVVFGAPPLKPETGFGYIERGKPVKGIDGAFEVRRFVEKPDLKTAKRFLRSGRHWVNVGIFVWKTDVYLEAVRANLPGLHRRLRAIARDLDTPLELKSLNENFQRVKSVSVDKGILEKARNVFVVRAGFDWSDVGSWSALYDVWPMDGDGNVCVGRNLAIDTKNTLIYSPNKLVATLGLSDVMIVETEDALLVCHRDRAQDVSRFVDILRERKEEEFL